MNRGQKPKKGPRPWVPLVVIVLLLAGGALLWRTGFHSVGREGAEPEPAPSQEEPPPPAPPAVEAPTGKSRQPIFDRNMATLAVSFKQSSIYIKPIELQEGEKAVDRLTALLGLSADKVRSDLRSERGLFWLKRNLDAETTRKVAESKYSGVYLVDELLRYYPFHDHAAHVVGFVKGEQGLAGAEFIYDTILSGERTLASQYLNLPGINAAELPASGASAVVSVDIDLQLILEKKLQHLQQQTGAQSVSTVVIEAGSGEILAMANLPAYDPNLYWKAAVAAHQNKVLSEPVSLAGINAFLKAAAELARGNLPPELAEREAEAERVISPQAIKIAKSDVAIPATPESQVWQPGIHLSPPFQWPLRFTQDPGELASFCATLGLAGSGSGLGDTRLEGASPPAMDTPSLLEDDAARAYPLQLLAAFAQLTNGGNAIVPHLLRGVWKMEEETFLPAAFPVTKGIGPQASANFIGFVEGLLPPGPGEDLVIESVRSKVRLAELAQAKVREQEPSRSIEDALRFTSVTLAAGRQGEKQLALIIMVDGAKFNLALPSPVRKTATEIIGQAHALLATRWGDELRTPHLDSDALLYQKWRLSQEAGTAPAQPSRTTTLEMPDLIGMSLRKAMQALQGFNLKVTIQGSGRVIRQTPAADVLLTGEEEVKLELEMDKD